MRTLLGLAALLALAVPAAAGPLMTADRTVRSDCKNLNRDTAREFFEVAVPSKTVVDRKAVMFQSLDTYATNYILLSTFAAISADTTGYPLAPALGNPVVKLEYKGRVFLRLNDAVGVQYATATVCVGLLE